MNYFLVIVATATILASAQTQDDLPEVDYTQLFKEPEIECAKEKNISLDILAKTKTGTFPIDDNKLNCYTECLFDKFGFVINGVIQVETILNAARARGGDTYANIARQCCEKPQGDDVCDTTYQIYRCYFKNINKPGISTTDSTTDEASTDSEEY